MNRLTDLEIRKWVKEGNPIAGKSDGGGLTFTLSKAGRASWVLRYRYGGKGREITIGNLPLPTYHALTMERSTPSPGTRSMGASWRTPIFAQETP